MKKSTSVGIKQQSVKIRELTPKKNPKGGAGPSIGGISSSKLGANQLGATKIVYTGDEVDSQ
jgi:hypothetical protein